MRLKDLEKGLKGLLFRLLTPLKRKELEVERIRFSQVRRVLVVRGDERLGNLLMLTPFFKLLKSSFPQAKLWALVSGRFSSLLKGNPNVDGLISLNKRGFLYNPLALIKFLSKLMGIGFDLSFDCSHQDSPSFNNGLFTLLSLAPYRVGFRRGGPNPFLNLEVPPPQGKVHQIEANFALIRAMGKGMEFEGEMEVFLTPVERKKAGDMLRNLGIDGSTFLVGIHPGGRRDKRWGTGKFVAIAQKIREVYRFPVIFFQGPLEKGILGANQSSLLPGVILLPQMALREFASLLSHCGIFISGDCGPMHLASALGVPTLSVFLVGNSYRYAPRGDHHRTVYRGEGPSVADVLREFDSLIRELKVESALP